ncbi:MAG TPA: ATP-binding protein [Thermoprotei archaeon]|nr:MAG: hypothetical protein DRJ63_06860 [Thermoprotei archaeon]HDI75415.1 ATP-binding protein [Thermoprotei archaeon]
MEEYNPWWLNESDPFYEKWVESKVKWVPSVIGEFSFKPYALHFFIGPRQVGKTTTLKIIIHNLLKTRDPRSIFYYSCDELLDYRELGEVLDNYLSARKEWGVKSSIIFLDEVTFVDEWYRALKSRIDRGLFSKDVIVVTGSASLELVAGKERFPGRRGFGKDIYMMPLSFREYLLNFSKLEVQGAEVDDLNKLMKKMKANTVFSKTINIFFEKYLETGGFPVPIKEYFERGKVTHISYKTYLDWLKADWIKAGKSENYMKEIISYLLEAGTVPVSWHTISKSTSISSPHTVREYIELLENLLVLEVLYWTSPSGQIDYRKAKKIVFIDPFLYQIFSSYTKVEVDEATVVEATIAAHLARVKPIYYWKNKTEVDIVVLDKKPLGFEVKWTRKPKLRRRPIKTYVLDKNQIPVFLATLSVSKYSARG